MEANCAKDRHDVMIARRAWRRVGVASNDRGLMGEEKASERGRAGSSMRDKYEMIKFQRFMCYSTQFNIRLVKLRGAGYRQPCLPKRKFLSLFFF